MYINFIIKCSSISWRRDRECVNTYKAPAYPAFLLLSLPFHHIRPGNLEFTVFLSLGSIDANENDESDNCYVCVLESSGKKSTLKLLCLCVRKFREEEPFRYCYNFSLESLGTNTSATIMFVC